MKDERQTFALLIEKKILRTFVVLLVRTCTPINDRLRRKTEIYGLSGQRWASPSHDSDSSRLESHFFSDSDSTRTRKLADVDSTV